MKIEIESNIVDKTFIKKLCICIAVIMAFTFTALYLNKKEEEKRERIRKHEAFEKECREAWYDQNTNWREYFPSVR